MTRKLIKKVTTIEEQFVADDGEGDGAELEAQQEEEVEDGDGDGVVQAPRAARTGAAKPGQATSRPRARTGG